MATYGGWTELREYRVWSGEDVWQVTTVSKHANGWYNVDTDGYDVPYRTRSESEAYDCATQRTDTGIIEAANACPCKDWDEADKLECYSFNVYDSPHGVRRQIVDMPENRSLDEFEL